MKKLCLLLFMVLAAATATAGEPVRRSMSLSTGEHVLGYYTTDDLPTTIFTNQSYLGLNDTPGSDYHACTVFETPVTARFVGGTITRFRYAIADTTPVKGYFICELPSNYYLFSGYDPLVEVVYATPYTPTVGWNEVVLAEDNYVEIAADKYYAIGFIYDQTTTNYPLVTDRELATDYSSQYGFFVYGNVMAAYGYDWYYYEDGQLCIQAAVYGGDFGDYDIALSGLSVDPYVQEDSEINFSCTLTNYGMCDIDSYVLTVTIDDTVVATLDTPVALTAEGTTYSGSVALPAALTAGSDSHTLTVAVATINGEAPTSYTSDDVVSGTFHIYSESVPRQKFLIEQLTSVQCVNCPKGYSMIEMMLANSPGKYSWAALHTIGMGDDPYYISYVDYPEYFYGYRTYNSTWGWPSAIFNRAYLDAPEIDDSGSVGIIMGWAENQNSTAATLIDAALDKVYASRPAFVSVSITPEYDADSRTLALTVEGQGVEFAQDILADNVLYVYIIEDGLYGYQLGATNSSNYLHRNVLRYVATSTYGDDIGWTSDSAYSNTYSLTLDSAWNADNIRIIAFITGSMVAQQNGTLVWADPYNAYVNNCEEVSLDGTVVDTGIASAAAISDRPQEVARYTIAGRKITAPSPGVNIVTYSDGTVKKVLIK